MDQYEAKYELWAREQKVYALPKAHGLPPFKPQKFDSYEAFNRWKRAYLDEIASRGGVTWTR
ncbi:MAG: hypothetical protein A2498_06965 [Lentisphaerae bacterium RIFOXYC12_FULL_60_16]|nr:MAG: hypothetical protein A2498_06965 [Lentisphaerae bacterium RIFOXYC12_FULL_60_16]